MAAVFIGANDDFFGQWMGFQLVDLRFYLFVEGLVSWHGFSTGFLGFF